MHAATAAAAVAIAMCSNHRWLVYMAKINPHWPERLMYQTFRHVLNVYLCTYNVYMHIVHLFQLGGYVKATSAALNCTIIPSAAIDEAQQQQW